MVEANKDLQEVVIPRRVDSVTMPLRRLPEPTWWDTTSSFVSATAVGFAVGGMALGVVGNFIEGGLDAVSRNMDKVVDFTALLSYSGILAGFALAQVESIINSPRLARARRRLLFFN